MSAHPRTHALLREIKSRQGFVPNFMREISRSPAALSAYVDVHRHLEEGSLTHGERQAVALAVSLHNHCDYCLAADHHVARAMGVNTPDLEAIVAGDLPEEPRLRTLVSATWLVLEKRGWLDEDDLEWAETSGITREQLYEIITIIGLKTVSNYINHIAQTEIDPEIQEGPAQPRVMSF